MPDGAYGRALQGFQDRTSGTVCGAEGVDATGTQVEEMLREAAEGTAPSDTVAAE